MRVSHTALAVSTAAVAVNFAQSPASFLWRRRIWRAAVRSLIPMSSPQWAIVLLTTNSCLGRSSTIGRKESDGATDLASRQGLERSRLRSSWPRAAFENDAVVPGPGNPQGWRLAGTAGHCCVSRTKGAVPKIAQTAQCGEVNARNTVNAYNQDPFEVTANAQAQGS